MIAAFVYLVTAALLMAGARALGARPTTGEALILVAVPVLVLWSWFGGTILAPVDGQGPGRWKSFSKAMGSGSCDPWSIRWPGEPPTTTRSVVPPIGRSLRVCTPGPSRWLGLASALMARSTRRRALLLAGIGGWGWLVGGGFRPLTALVSQLPGLGLTSTTRALPLVSLALALAMGLGVEAWCRRPPVQRFALAVGALGLLAAVSGGGLRWGVLTSGVLGAAWLVARSPRLGALALAAVLTTDQVGVARRFLPRGEPHFFYPTNEAIANIRRGCRRANHGGS